MGTFVVTFFAAAFFVAGFLAAIDLRGAVFRVVAIA
jgi:hypothetical protein